MTADAQTTILVVDDNPATLYATSRLLRGAGWTVLEAATGTEALASARSRELSMIVLDVNLPDIDGFEVCRRLQADPVTEGTPVIHLSASFINDYAKVQGLEGGAVGYLTQPVEPAVLLATIRAFLRMRRAEYAMRSSEAKFKAVFDNAINGISLMTENLVFLDVNPAMRALLGETQQKIAMKPLSSYVPTSLKEEPAKIIRQIESNDVWRGILPLMRPDGTLVYLEWNISVHSEPGIWLAIVNDISQRLEIEREREALLAQERAARADAERANRLKDDFLAMVSHELRTPLNAIVGWSELLKRDELDEADFAKGLAIIARNAKAQADLINDLLDISRIISGKLELDVEVVDAVGMVEAALAAVAPAAEAKHIRITKLLDEKAGVILGDAARLQQVVWNLVTNAVKFTEAGGQIEIHLTLIGPNVEITFRDTGQGIKAELLPHIFDRFRQGDSSTIRGYRGLGLGLAIAKHLVEMHGGTIKAESEGEGKGSAFTVSVPSSGADANLDLSSRPSMSGPIHAEPQAQLEGIRILVVDDDTDSRLAVQRLLNSIFAETREAASAAEALAAIEKCCPDVLITDIGMPGQDGYDLIKEIRARGYTPQALPAIALTAFAYSGDRERALLEGFQAHMAKPVNFADLTMTLTALAKRDSINT